MRKLQQVCMILTLVVVPAIGVPQQASRNNRSSLAIPPPIAASAETPSDPNREEWTAQQGGGTIVRTLVYHQITTLTTSPNSREQPVLSESGNRAAFAIAPGTQDPARPNRIFVVNADGTGQREVDAYQSLVFAGSGVDISADGSTVISSEGVRLRIASASGSAGRDLIAFDGGEINTIRISGNGSRIFFVLRRGTRIRGTATAIGPGLFTINADVSGLREIVSQTQVGSLLGIPANAVFPFSGGGASLAASTDGSRLIFTLIDSTRATSVTGKDGGRIFTVNSDGSGLRHIFGPTAYVNGVAISGNGTKVAFNITNVALIQEGRTANFEGTGQLLVATNQRFGFTDLNTETERISMTRDGSAILFGTYGHLFDVATGDTLQLAAGGPGGVPPLVTRSMPRATMDGSGRRFLYLAGDANNVLQLATLDIDPLNRGAAPGITGPTLNPAFVLNGNRTSATLTARVSATNILGQVGNVSLRDGLYDDNAPRPDNGMQVMSDDGANGDGAAGDGVFGNNRIFANSNAVVGPRTVRIKAEARSGDGTRHATAVDVAPFFVLSQSPAGSGPRIEALSPASGMPGIQVRIMGTGFDPTAANNVVIVGNRLARVVSVNSSGTELVVTIPTGLSPGTVQVTVSAQGQTSNGAIFVVSGGGGGGAQWAVRMFNIDDTGTVSVNGMVVLQASLGQDTGLVDITVFLQNGANNVTFTLDNAQGRYSHGFDVYRDGALYLRDQCGILNVLGCNGNDQTLGRVYTRTVIIRP